MGKYYFLALILLMACSQTKETIDNGVETIVINTEATADSADVSSIIKEVRLVPLEEKENNFLEGVDKVLITENHYVLFDQFGSDQINVYDKEGKFIRQIVNMGDGPLEVRQVNDYWLNEEGCLEIYDFSLKKIVVFDDAFQADRSFKTKDLLIFQSVTKLLGHDGYVGFKSYGSYNGPFNNVHYKLGFLDKNFRLKNTALNYSAELDGVLITTPINPFERYRDSIRFFQNFDPTIYHVQSPDTLIKRFEIKYQPNSMPDNWEQELILPNGSIFKSKDYDFGKVRSVFQGRAGFAGAWKESGKYVIFNSFDENYKPFYSIYSKSENKVLANGRVLVEKERYKLAIHSFQAVDEENEMFVSVWQGALLKEYLLMENSPFNEEIEDSESLYLIEVVFQ